LDWDSIQQKWNERWCKDQIFETDPVPGKPKYFLTVAYPYPNSPQHIGHGRTYTLTDVYARYKRMNGFQVLFPMAFHYTGTPILAMSKRIAEGDKELIDTFKKIYKINPEIIPTLIEPIKIAKYFHEEIKAGMKEIGYSIDWRREFTTIDPQYSAFIHWQFNKLRKKGLIIRGSHPVGWCPKDRNPVGQHDTLGDVEPEIGEYTLIMFKLMEYRIPTATLRPETVFGVTNIWINPEATYVKATVDGELWILSQETVEKLQHISMKITVKEKIKGSDLIGKEVENPLTKTKVSVLPASFVDPRNGTGIVMSVPAHAPYDFQALKDLGNRPEILLKYKLKNELIHSIKIPVIVTSDGYSEIPSEQIIKKMKINNQNDPKLEDATSSLYKHEFHIGKMSEMTGKFSGMPISVARDKVKDHILSAGNGKVIYEILNRPIKCRCGTECLVKIFEKQWFINYGESKWKDLARKCIDKIEIIPEDIRPEFDYTIGWLKRKACARKSGLGTKLPWDEEWIIESLSDSVIYMAYYLISKYVNEHKLLEDQLTDKVFDYILLGEGDFNEVSQNSRINNKILKKMREEFEYFYPVDSRHSGRDLIPNHLTFFIFNHSAIFQEENWPRQIVVNGSVLMGGKKMSKSFGNIIPLREAVKTYGADPLRLAILATAELLQDADISLNLVKSFNERLERLYGTIVWAIEKRGHLDKKEFRVEDRWMLSRLQMIIKQSTEALEKLRCREAIHNIIYLADQDVQWYLRRTKVNLDKERTEIITAVVYEVIQTRIRLLAPLAPFISEEIWELMGNGDSISSATWPKLENSKIDIEAEDGEELIKNLLEDTLNIIRVTNIKPKKVTYYTSSKWKWGVYQEMLHLADIDSLDMRSLMNHIMKKKEIKERAKEVSLFTKKLIKEVRTVPIDMRRRRLKTKILNEFTILKTATDFLENEFEAKVSVFSEDDPDKYDPKARSSQSKPFRPAIFIE
jgi:leucyl-tRNA synthetase|tara:strand:- start:575 stop:3487 length:2913 start_codon:yes stop_codon:yes gene_type:complete